MSGFDFHSDNAVGVHPKVLDALLAANAETAAPYGADPWTPQVNPAFSEVFETECHVYSVLTGTAANGLALGAVTPSYGAIFCHSDAHVFTTECGAPEFYSNGARLVPIDGHDGKISPDGLSAALAGFNPASPHQLMPTTLSLTQSTEAGTVYSLNALNSLCDIAHAAGLRVHMDGARFANALVALDVSPADMTWRAGIDILSLGTTKNGTMNTEAIVVFDTDTAHRLKFLHKRAGFLTSKMRFMSAQLLSYLKDGLWLENARMANRNASRMKTALNQISGVNFESPVEANEIFVSIPPNAKRAIERGGFRLRPWMDVGPDCFRLVASYCDPADMVRRFEDTCANLAPKTSETNATSAKKAEP